MDGVGLPEDREKAEEWLMEGVKVLVDEQRSIENIPSSAMYSFLFIPKLMFSFFFLLLNFFLAFIFSVLCPQPFLVSKTLANHLQLRQVTKSFNTFCNIAWLTTCLQENCGIFQVVLGCGGTAWLQLLGWLAQ